MVERYTQQEIERLYVENYEGLARYATSICKNRDEGEDLVSQAFAEFIENPPERKEDSNLEAIVTSKIRKVFLNSFKDSYKRRKHDFGFKTEEEIEGFMSQAAEENKRPYDQRENAADFKKSWAEAINRLPRINRQVLDYRIVRGWNAEDTAKEMGTYYAHIVSLTNFSYTMLKKMLAAKGIKVDLRKFPNAF